METSLLKRGYTEEFLDDLDSETTKWFWCHIFKGHFKNSKERDSYLKDIVEFNNQNITNLCLKDINNKYGRSEDIKNYVYNSIVYLANEILNNH